MIPVTRLNHNSLVLNADLIEIIEATPDTVISLTTGEKLVVLEPVEEVVRRVLEFRRAVHNGTLLCPRLVADAECPVQPSASPGNPLETHGRNSRGS